MMLTKSNQRSFLTLFFLAIANFAFAQFIITGKVVTQENKKPQENATVFIDKTGYTTKTDKNGNFALYNLQRGHYDLIVSMIGFKTYKLAIAVESDTKVARIEIEEKITALDEVKITRSKKKLGSKYMDLFKLELLGSSHNGKQCNIVNPEVIKLQFDDAENKLTAYTTDFLLIDNKALGYRLKYLVEYFERNEKKEMISYLGYVLFEPMRGNKQQVREWDIRRQYVYTGSLQHFFRSVLGNNINKEDEPSFLVTTDTRMLNKSRLPDTLINKKISLYRSQKSQSDKDSLFFWTNMLQQPRYIEVVDSTKLKTQQLVHPTEQKGLYALRINQNTNYINQWESVKVPELQRTNFKCDTCQFKNSLYITYLNNIPKNLGRDFKLIYTSGRQSFAPTAEMNKMASLLSVFDDQVFFDWNGVIVNPMSLKLERYWAKLRLGDLLPIDYLPNTSP